MFWFTLPTCECESKNMLFGKNNASTYYKDCLIKKGKQSKQIPSECQYSIK